MIYGYKACSTNFASSGQDEHYVGIGQVLARTLQRGATIVYVVRCTWCRLFQVKKLVHC